jgi:hypothetical protein
LEGRLKTVFGKKHEGEKLSETEREAKVSSALAEAQNCAEKNDTSCTVRHLAEAKKYEACPPCRRQIARAISAVPYLPREQQATKVQLTREYVEGAAPLRRKSMAMESIKPTRKAVVLGKTKNTLRSMGHGLKSVGGWIKRKALKPKEVK